MLDPTTTDLQDYAAMQVKHYLFYLASLKPLGFTWLNPNEVTNDLTNINTWKTLIQQGVADIQHPSGSCRMAVCKEKGVCDDKLRVFGVKGLRLCDNSIWSIQPDNNLCPAAVLAGFNLARMLRRQYGK